MFLKHEESSAAPLPQHRLNSMQYYRHEQINYTQDNFSLPNSQLYYRPQALQSNQAPQPYPGFFHKRSPPHTNSNIARTNFRYKSESTLPIPEIGKDISSEKNLNVMIQFKGSSEIVGHYSDRSGRNVEEGTSYRNYTNYLSTSSAANGDEALDGSHDINQDPSALKKNQRLNQTKADDYPMGEDSAADMLGTTLNLGMMYNSAGAVSTTIKISDDSELRKQRRKQKNRESARRSRLRKQQECENLQERIQALNADNSGLAKELRSLSEECARIVKKNKRIKEELVQMYKSDSIVDDLKDSWPELFN